MSLKQQLKKRLATAHHRIEYYGSLMQTLFDKLKGVERIEWLNDGERKKRLDAIQREYQCFATEVQIWENAAIVLKEQLAKC